MTKPEQLKSLVALCMTVSCVISVAPTNLLGQAANRRRPEVSWVNSKLPEAPGLTHCVLKSEKMGHDVGYVVWTPADFDNSGSMKYPVIYFLHGMGGNEASDSGGFSSLVQRAIRDGSMPAVICVFPNGGRSGYRGDVAEMIVDELIPLIEQTYPTQPDARARAVAGFSMGGAGAIRLSITHPGLFCAAGSWGGGMRRNADTLLEAAEAGAETLRQNSFAALLVNGDRDRPDAYKPLVEKLSDLQIACETLVLKDTPHNLGLYYERSGERMTRFLGQRLQHGAKASSDPLPAHQGLDLETSGDNKAGFPVQIRVDATKDLGELREIWRFFGADEPNYAYMPHGAKLVGELGQLRPKQVFFRAHNLLTSGDGTPALKWGSTNVYTEDDAGRPIYDWTIVDRIFDTYLERDVRPYAQIGFMPKALSIKPEPYQHRWRVGAPYEEIYTGWAYPPSDYDRWGELVFQWVKHCVDRYGADEVATWYWETWNEANIPYWQGTPEEFYKLHDYAIAAVRRALPNAKVGGPDVAGHGGQFMRRFLDHCLTGTNYATGERGTPIDFISFHAKGAPQYVDGHVRMGISRQLRTIDAGFRMIASYERLKHKPIIIGESDPEGCAACQGPQLAYRNGTMYSSYTAASFARKLDLADQYGVNLEGALTWAFEFEGHPYFAGFRSLASNGIDKPVMNVFRMYSKMSGRRIAAHSDGASQLDRMLRDGVRGEPDVSALASLDGQKLCVMVWHYHDDDLPGPDANVKLTLAGPRSSTSSAMLTHYRIDEAHSNAYAHWKNIGSPQSPTDEQYAELELKGQLARISEPEQVEFDSGETTLRFDLPRAAVSLLVLRLADR